MLHPFRPTLARGRLHEGPRGSRGGVAHADRRRNPRRSVRSVGRGVRFRCDQEFSSTLLRIGKEAGLPADLLNILKGLILAQNERWRRGLGMQVERIRSSDRVSGARVSKATVTNPEIGYSRGKLRVIPSDASGRHRPDVKAPASRDGLSWY